MAATGRCLAWALVLALPAGEAWAHGSGWGGPPPPPDRPEDDPTPRRETEPQEPPPPPPPAPDPGYPVTPEEPDPPPDWEPSGPRSGRPGRPDHRPSSPRSRPRPTRSGVRPWRLWWEYNREHRLGLRGMLRDPGVITGGGRTRPVDPLAGRRAEVRAALREVAARERDPTLRAAALIALGRTGDAQDARFFLGLLRDRRRPKEVLEAAAIGLGILPSIDDPETERAARLFLEYVLRHPQSLPRRARGFAVVAAGLRARRDKRLMPALVARCTGPVREREDAAVLAFAAGLTLDPMIVPELVQIARKRAIGRLRLGDVHHAHVAQALGLTGSPFVADRVTFLLRSRKSGLQTRRSAALALGRLLRETDVSEAAARNASLRLLKELRGSPDPLLRGFCALALGGARTPQGVPDLMRAVDREGDFAVKDFAALALGLALPRLEGRAARDVRSFLLSELHKTKDVELSSALCIAAGLGGGDEAREPLLDRLGSTSLPAPVRGAAAQGLGLLRRRSPDVENALLEVLRTARDTLLEDTALALGLIGRRGTALKLVEMLPAARTTRTQGRILIALGHLGNSVVVDPLLRILKNRGEKTIVREFAAVALGLLGDPRERDPLFALDADFNFEAATPTTHELIRLY
ncbi:MAG: HEAT repeat domain-containing protein [Planctomycetota bacterium]